MSDNHKHGYYTGDIHNQFVEEHHDPKGKALGSLENFSKDPRLNHQFEVHSGLYANEASSLLKKFFRAKRIQKKSRS